MTISNCAAGNGGTGCLISYTSSPDATNWFGGDGARGGAIYNAGRLQLLDSMLISNSSGKGGNGGGENGIGAAGGSGGGGGAIYNIGWIMLTGCNLEHNIAGSGGDSYRLYFGTLGGGRPGGSGGHGGAICDAGQTETFISDSEFSFNSSGAGASGTPDDYSLLQSSFAGAGGGGGGGGADGPPPRYSSTVARSNPIRPAQAGLEVMVSTLAVKEESVARAVLFVPWAA